MSVVPTSEQKTRSLRPRQRLARSLAATAPVLVLARLAMHLGWSFSRMWSHVRFKALVVNSGDSVCHWSTEFQHPQNLRVGERVAIGPHCRIACGAEVVIEDDVTLSRGVIIETAGLEVAGDPPYPHKYRPILIRQGAWIATNAIVLAGVTVGRGAVVGAGAVVSKDVPDGAIVVGAGNRQLMHGKN